MVGFQLHFSDLARIVEEPRFRRLVCAKCNLVAREPQTVTCGHRFCRSCLHDMYRNLQNEIAICPVDGKEIHQICSDDNGEVLAIEVHCILMDVGCKWKGELRHLKIHMEKCHPEGPLASTETIPHNPSLTSGHPHGSPLFSLFGDRRLGYSAVERPNHVERPRPAENQQVQFPQQQGESVEMNRALANLTMDFERLQCRMQRRGEHDATHQMKTEFDHLRRDMERLQNRIQVLEEHRGSPSATRQEILEANEELKRQLANERQDRERKQEEWQTRLQAMERTLAVFSAALENEKRDNARQLDAQRNSFEAFHDECVAERERTSDDRNMEVALLQNSIEQLQNSHADLQNSHAGLQNSHADLQNSHADLQTRVRRLERR